MMISIIIAAYNCERFLEQAIRSVQSQTVCDLEIVVIDDGSKDGTLGLARDLASREPRMRVLTQENSGGPAAPRNKGIAIAEGDFVCFLDPDDYWYETKLERQLGVMSAYPDVDLVFSDMHRVRADGARMAETYLGRVGYLERAREHLSPVQESVFVTAPGFLGFSSVEVVGPVTSAVMVRRRALQAQQELFPTDLPIGEDIDLWFRIMQCGQLAFIDEPLHAYRQHEASLMHNQSRVTVGSIAAHTRNFARVAPQLSMEQIDRYRSRIAGHYADLGYEKWMNLDMSSAREAYAASLKWRRGRKAIVAYLKTLLPKALVRLARDPVND